MTPQSNSSVAAQAASGVTVATSSQEKVSVDQLTAASAVTQLAEMANLPVAGDLREATTTLYIKKQLAQNDAEVISSGGKPEVWVAAHARLHPDQKVWLSISHERQLASAVALIEVP